MSSSRFIADAAAIPIHIAFLVGTVAGNPDGTWGSVEGALLIAMESVAIAAHCWYVYLYTSKAVFSEEINTWKWGEYAVSATLGALAVLNSGTEQVPWQPMVLICALGASEMATGYTLDTSVYPGNVSELRDQIIWATAAIGTPPPPPFRSRQVLTGRPPGQVCEFVVVGVYAGVSAAYCLYVLFWSLYGVFSLLSLNAYPTTVNGRETGYSVLSTMAKLAVFVSAGLSLE